MAYGSAMESQVKTTQAALDRAAQRNGNQNDAPDVAAMVNASGGGAEPCADAVRTPRPFIGGGKPGGRQ